MTPEQQRIAIAEACGWKFHSFTENLYSEDERAAAIMCWVRPGNEYWQIECLPDYLNDLNAMHAAEKVLRRAPGTYQPGGIGHYSQLLEDRLGTEGKMLATASQRAEAFLRTLNLWKD